MLANTYNIEGKEMTKTQLPKEIFGKEVNVDLIRQIVFGMLSNKRQNIAHTKDRSEVRGGGKKPWQQKGTGRARHGSNRSPLWRHGGITFGPRNDKNYKRIMPVKMKKAALFSVLSGKLKDNEISIVDKFDLKENKTSYAAKALKAIMETAVQKGTTLITFSAEEKKLRTAFRNIAKCRVILAKDLNAAEAIRYKNIIFTKEAVYELEKTFVK